MACAVAHPLTPVLAQVSFQSQTGRRRQGKPDGEAIARHGEARFAQYLRRICVAASGWVASICSMNASRQIEVLDPRYNPGHGPVDDGGAVVETSVEALRWEPRTPPAAPPGPLAFVDGAQRVEAWLRVASDGDPIPTSAAAIAIGVGAVIAVPGNVPTIVHTTIERLVVTSGPGTLGLPATDGIAWRSVAATQPGPDPIAQIVSGQRSQLEHTVAERVATRDGLVVLDGRRAFVREGDGPIMGAIKSHQRAYLHDEAAAVMAALGVGQRTPLFAIGDDRWSWYQRLPVLNPTGWQGILRGELPQTLGIAAAAALADRATRELPRFAGIPHRDPRAPQNLTPIGALEAHLRRRLGDRRLMLRLIRRAAHQAGIESLPAEFEAAA